MCFKLIHLLFQKNEEDLNLSLKLFLDLLLQITILISISNILS